LDRKSPLTPGEIGLILAVNPAALVASAGLSACEQLVLQHKQAMRKVKLLLTKQSSLDHARCLRANFCRLFRFLTVDTTDLTAYLAQYQYFLNLVRSQNCHDDGALVEKVEEARTQIEAELHSSRVYATKVSDVGKQSCRWLSCINMLKEQS
jgi:hypothetical protein